MKNFLIKFFLIFSVFILSQANIYSQGGPASPFFHDLILEGTGSNTHFKLVWMLHPADTNNIVSFKIYKADYFTSNASNLSYYTTVNRTGSDTTWSFNISNLTVGNYSFYVTSVRTSGSFLYESAPSNIKQGRFKQGHVDVTFQTYPPTKGAIGTLYQYSAHATSTDPARVNYLLKTAPGNMSVNSSSGLVQWTPNSIGRYNVTLNAYLNFNPGIIHGGNGKGEGYLGEEPQIDTSDCDVNQSWVLQIKSCINPTYIAGKVIDDNGDTVRSGTVSVYSNNNIDSGSIYYGQIDSNGLYNVEVFEGLYKIKVEGYGIETQWFFGKSSMDSANPFYAYCGITNTLNFVVKKLNIPDTITFHSEPPATVLTNDLYEYYGTATASSGRQLRYQLDSAPKGMTVDPYIGHVMWSPTKIGRYFVSLKAYVIDDSANSYAYKNWYFQVRSCSGDTYVKGTVKDSAGIAIKQGMLEIYSDGGIDSVGIYSGNLNSQGKFLIKIDEGNCKTFIRGEGFESQWFDNKSSYDSANAVPCPCGDTTSIDIIVNRNPPINLAFTSVPVDSMVTGSIYSYTPVIIGNEGREVRFILTDKAHGMIINDKTGVITCSTETPGGYPITLKAYLYTDSANSFTVQSWWLKVRSCRTSTYISGTVKDNNDNAIAEGTIKIISDSRIEPSGVYTGKIIDGAYHIPIDEGNSKIFVEGPTFLSQWYNNKTSEDSASIINVPCGSNTMANLKVQLAKNYTVSGNVSDIQSGNPIPGANVYFKNPESIDSVITDINGNYSIILSDRFIYYAWANVPDEPKYITQYYMYTENITESTPISLAGDVSNIDFILKSAPSSSNIMFGTVENQQGMPIKSIVLNFLIFPVDTSLGKMFSCRTFETNENGFYEFRNLAAGDFILMAVPDDINYLTGYFKTDTSSVKSWIDATMIKITDGEQNGPHIIKLSQVVPISGIGTIKGTITGDPLPVFLKKDRPLAKEDISGAVVICVDVGNKERKYNLTNTAGVYELDSIGAGAYTVYVDKVGYGPYSYNVTIDSSNTSSNESVGIDIHIPVSVIYNIEDKDVPIIYPNPSDGKFYLRLNADCNVNGISIYDIFGIKTSFEIQKLGTSTYELKSEFSPQGVYFVKIQFYNKTSIIPVSIIR